MADQYIQGMRALLGSDKRTEAGSEASEWPRGNNLKADLDEACRCAKRQIYAFRLRVDKDLTSGEA